MTGALANTAWRSLLFIPSDKPRIIEKAHMRGADALILDLEDAVPDAAKPAARSQLQEAITHLKANDASLLVRINQEDDHVVFDLQAAIRPGVDAIVVPKVEEAGRLIALASAIEHLEQQRGMPVGRIGLLALVESPAALFQLPAICAAPRLLGIALGSEDFSRELGAAPSPHSLTLPCQWLALAAAAAGIHGFGLPDSLANFQDLDRYAQTAHTAQAMGLRGALCIHPAQVAVVNAAFSPSEQDVAWALAVTSAWEKAREAGVGVVSLNGAMIDKPVVERARRMLAHLPVTHP
ncbi:HpcH/HpaI aldolase/citrate lyase family protein [Herbaspirillum sp. B65]|uniref:HpcH/HpaI aldolase/citrate lyase family protein n=1 Tax=Herbaspirillum sp. B65 TaxID=137708 RepID=UPI00034CE5D4|nr:CoA ester lyase [Herbaspirillum sp. B65]